MKSPTKWGRKLDRESSKQDLSGTLDEVLSAAVGWAGIAGDLFKLPPSNSNIRDRLHTELWTSFASQIRSYGAAHGLNSTHQAVVEVSSDLILLRVGTKWLQFTPTEMTDDNGVTQTFRLNEDGTVTVGDVTEDMDFTAERLTRELMH